MQRENEQVGAGSVVQTLVDRGACTYCDGDALERAEYKGNDAVVCDQCGTPVAQFW